ncbi:ABC transporter permease [Carboxylicivirga linearis]|uniref:ABC transporter permease n=1 Tax=Carboxylicivirga linearis TaxID=1628157 RepID=A0ABS5JXS9_9BACT|nr:ABC transporter permease [Carboxylicivirga linearis]MBS2099643.1 ABC transporter permease [Carboxylicivirga linearis]
MLNKEQYQGIKGLILREWHEILENRTLRMCLVYFPLLALIFFTWFFKAQQPENLPVAIIDTDNSATSSKLVNMLDATSELKLVRKYTDLKSAESALKQGIVYGVVAIPDDFERSVMKSEQADVVMLYNNELLIPAGTVSKAVNKVTATMGAGINIKRNMMKGDSYDAALKKAQPIIIDSQVMFNSTVNYLYFLVSGILPALLQIFVLMVGGFVIGRELRNGTGKEWLTYADNSIIKAIIGKMTPYVAIFTIVGFTYNSVLYDYLNVPMNGSRLIVEAGQIVMILAYFGISFTLVAWSRNMRFSISISAIFGALAFSFSGLTFPVSGMPDIAQSLTHMFPFTHYLELFLNQAFYGAPAISGLARLGIMCGFIILPLVSIRRMKEVMSDSKFYGRL